MTPRVALEVAGAAASGVEAAAGASKPAVDVTTQAGRVFAEQARAVASGAQGVEGGLSAIANTPAATPDAWASLDRSTAAARQALEDSRARMATPGPEQPLPVAVQGSDDIQAASVSIVENPISSPSPTTESGGGVPPGEVTVTGTAQPSEENGRPIQPDAQSQAPLTQEQITAAQINADANRQAARQAELKSWSADQLADEISRQENIERAAFNMMSSPKPTEAQMSASRDQLARSQQRLEELRGAQRNANRPERKSTADDDARREAARESRERLEEYRKLAKLPSDELNAEGVSEKAVLEALKREREASGPIDQVEIDKRIRDSEAKLEAINNLKEARGPEEAARKEKAEAEANKAEEARGEAETIRLRAEQATPEDVTNFGETVENIKGEISGFESAYAEHNASIAAENDPTRKAGLSSARSEIRKNLIDARNRLKVYQEALNVANEKIRERAGPSEAIDSETVRVMSNAEYQRLTPDQKQAHLLELSRTSKTMTKEQYQLMQMKIKNGDNFSQNELGQFVGYAKDRLMAGDKKMLADVYALNAKYSEVAQSIFAAINASEEGNKLLEGIVEGKFEKIKNNKGLLMMLLAILAAIVVGAGKAIAEEFSGKK